MSAPRWITEADVAQSIDLRDAIDALTRGLREEAAGSARNMEKTAAHWGKSSNMHAIGAVFEGANVFGTKTWGNTPEGGSTPLLILWNATTAKLWAIIEARALGQVAAVAAVRPLRRIRVFSPTPAKRNAFADKLRSMFPGTEIKVADDAAHATDGASIITLITRAREPVLSSSMVARGAHVNAAGAITQERREFSQDLFPRATLVAVDTVPGTRQLSAEFIDWFDGKCGGDWTRVQPISAVIAAGKPRPGNTDVSLFKPMGMGISDVSLGIEVVRRAEASGIGRSMPEPGFAVPRISTVSRQEPAA